MAGIMRSECDGRFLVTCRVPVSVVCTNGAWLLSGCGRLAGSRLWRPNSIRHLSVFASGSRILFTKEVERRRRVTMSSVSSVSSSQTPLSGANMRSVGTSVPWIKYKTRVCDSRADHVDESSSDADSLGGVRRRLVFTDECLNEYERFCTVSVAGTVATEPLMSQ